MKIQEYNSQIEFVNSKDFSESESVAAITTMRDTEVIYGAEGSCNTEWCNENGVGCVHKDKLQGGGCIVCAAGNVLVDVKKEMLNGGECLSDTFAKAVCTYLKEQGLNSVRQDNNDVLVDDYKVASGCESSYNNLHYMGYQISINQDMEIIEHACNKEMIKVPKGLYEYGITTEQIVEFCKEYWSNFE